MKRIIAFAGSNSKNSINKQLVGYTAQQLQSVTTEVLDLNDYELPIYGIDHEREHGIPENAQRFLDEIKSSDGMILSLAEHNGAYSTAFKNLFDWMSRIDGKLWSDKPMFLIATSPGGRGGASVLEIAKSRFPHMGGNIVAEFSLPSFGQNFSDAGITDAALRKTFENSVAAFERVLTS